MRFVNSLVLVGVCVLGVRCGESPEEPPAVPVIATLDRGELLLSYGKGTDAAVVAALLRERDAGNWRVHDLTARIHLHEALRLRDEGLMEHAAEELAAVVAAYRAATTLAPDISGLHQSAASAAHMAGEHEQSAIWFREAMALNGDDPRPPLCLAQLVFDSDPAEARRLLDRVIVLDSSIAEAHASVALLEAIAGREASALAAMATALRCGAHGPDIRVVQARMHRVLGGPGRGVEVLYGLSARERASEAAATELVRCWEALGRPDRVADAWAACFTANAHRTDAWTFALRAADAHLLAGDRPSAANCIAQAEMLSAPRELVEAVRQRASDQGP
jgi:tetratricopeptide (TPR) repeat protein